MIGDLVDLIDFCLNRLEAIGLDLRLVHAAGVVIADLLLVAALTRGRVTGRGLENLAQHVAILFVQNVRDAPGRISRWDRIRRQPSAVGVLIEIGAGRRLRIHIRYVEAGALSERSRQTETYQQRTCDESFE